MMADDWLQGLRTSFENFTQDTQVLFLCRYIHELTVAARGYFLEQEFERARLCNESIHRIAGHVCFILCGMVPSGANESFVSMLIDGANARGWSSMLERSFRHATSAGIR